MLELDQSALNELEQTILEAGSYAKEKQKGITTKTKDDGTPVTNTDLYISSLIIDKIHTLFPFANVISEETKTPFSYDAPFTFILDPIDGTDVYSQGLPCFAIALGILNSERKAVGAMIYAPRFGVGEDSLFLRLDPNKEVLLNGKTLKCPKKDNPTQITLSSKAHRNIDLSNYKGKVRIFGSTILHLISPLVFSNISLSVATPCYVWDFASAHAVLIAMGYELKYQDLTEVEYTDSLLIERKTLKGTVFAGTEEGIKSFVALLK